MERKFEDGNRPRAIVVETWSGFDAVQVTTDEDDVAMVACFRGSDNVAGISLFTVEFNLESSK